MAKVVCVRAQFRSKVINNWFPNHKTFTNYWFFTHAGKLLGKLRYIWGERECVWVSLNSIVAFICLHFSSDFITIQMESPSELTEFSGESHSLFISSLRVECLNHPWNIDYGANKWMSSNNEWMNGIHLCVGVYVSVPTNRLSVEKVCLLL